MQINRNSELVSKCDRLHSILNDRFNDRVFNRIDESIRDNFSIHWFRTNLSRFCALVTLLGQVVNDIESIDNTSTLLTHHQGPHSRFVCVLDAMVALEGCYLHYDCERHCWVRSGLAVGSDAIQRPMNEMERANELNSKAKISSDRFGIFYPSKESRPNGSVRRGWFENLQQYCGIGFDRSETTSSLYAVDDGIFYWDEASLKETNRLQAYDCETLHEKQLLMVGYCLELGYDLIIHPDNNIYRMLGFGYCLRTKETE